MQGGAKACGEERQMSLMKELETCVGEGEIERDEPIPGWPVTMSDLFLLVALRAD